MTKLGVEATSLQDITERAGVGTGTFYSYFTSKEDVAARVLDCLINNLFKRTIASVEAAHAEDPLVRIVIPVRGGLRELLNNRIWYWWLKQHPDLLVERTRRGFYELGTADLQRAVDANRVRLPGNNVHAAWSMLIWQMVAGVRDITDEYRSNDSEGAITVSILQALGVSAAESLRLTSGEAIVYGDLPIDFEFMLKEKDD